MKTIEINASKRAETGSKSAKATRREGMVPCVLYGGEVIEHVEIERLAFRSLIETPDTYLIELNIDGAKRRAVLKEVQYHPVTDKVIHADFLEVNDTDPVTVRIPVVTKGTARGVLNGGVLIVVRRKVIIKGLVNDIPETIELDIARLRIGHSIKVRDLNYNGLLFLDPQGGDIVAVKTSRGAFEEEEEEEEEETEEGAEGEGGEAKAEGDAKKEGDAKPAEGGSEEKKEEASAEA